MTSDVEAEINPKTESSAQTANDNASEAGLEKDLDKLYKRLPKLIARINENNMAEVGAAMQSLFASFSKINRLEKELLKPGEDYTPLSLSRLYELAVSGGGGNADTLRELEEANALFAEQNTILSELVESMTFQMDTIKNQAADEILDLGKAEFVPLAELRAAVEQVSGTMAKIEAQMALLRGSSVEEPDESGRKPLDERLAEGIIGLDDITVDLLKATPSSTTFVGRMLRRVGLAYDYKDIATTRQLVVAVLKANRKMTEISANLVPAQAQMEKIHHILNLVERFAGHEERENEQYKDALQEIERVKSQYARLEQKSGELEALEETLGLKAAEIEEQESKLRDLHSQKQEIEAEVIELRGDNDELQTKLDDVEKKLSTLTDEHRRMKRESSKTLWDLKDRIRQIEGGLLAEKLESEIISLRVMAKDAEEKFEKERELRLAFEERIQIWVEREEDLQKKLSFWQKKATLKATFFAAACGAGAFVGFMATELLAGKIASPMAWYFGVSIGLPALIAGGATTVGDGWRNGILALTATAAAGCVFTGLGYLAIDTSIDNADKRVQVDIAKSKAALEKSHVDFLTKDCENSPCFIVKGADGKYWVEVMSKKFNGEVVTLDFSKPSPTMTRQTPLAPAQPAAKLGQ